MWNQYHQITCHLINIQASGAKETSGGLLDSNVPQGALLHKRPLSNMGSVHTVHSG